MAKAKSKSLKTGESKKEKFERIAQRRTNLALRFLRLLGNLADRRNYDYSEGHVQQILNAIDQEVRSLKAKFRSDATEGAKNFQFGKE